MSERIGDEEAGKVEPDVEELKPSSNRNSNNHSLNHSRRASREDEHGDEGGTDDRERLLREDEQEPVLDHEEHDDEKKVLRIHWLADWLEAFWQNYRGTVWVVLLAASNLNARSLLRGKFPYPFYLTFVLQITSNVIFELWAVYKCVRGYRKSRLQSQEWRFGSSFCDSFFHAHRLILYSAASLASTLSFVYTLMRYPNFYVIALFPLFSYVCDSFLLHLASVVKFHPRRKLVDYLHFIAVLLVGAGLVPIFLTDYRLEEKLLPFLFATFGIESVSRVLLTLCSDYKEQRLNSTSFFIFERLLINVPQLVVSGVVAFKLENTVDALYQLRSWDLSTTFWTLLPGTLLLVYYGNGLTSVYRPPSHEEIFSVLEEVKPLAKETVGATLHGAILFSALRVFREPVLLNWYQAMAFAALYVVSLGPLHVGLYPQRLHNLIAFILRRRQRHTTLKSWALLTSLILNAILVGVVFACLAVYWTNTVAYHSSASKFINPPKAHIDSDYRPPRIRGLDVIIAHSNGHSHSALYNQIERIRTSKKVMRLYPMIQIITKDDTLAKKSDPKKVKEFHIETIPNVGGQAATFLYYILSKWATLPVQTLFISSVKDGEFDARYMTRIYEYFRQQGFPLADAEPKTGFLNLGDSEVCDCHNCHDSTGWEDTFGLVPSMYGASRPNITRCDSVLLTRGNHFFASAARIKGISKDVWQLLFDGLTNRDPKNGWSHEEEKFPTMLPGEKKMGRWDPQKGVYGVKDSLEEPLLGRTVERLWGVLFQCSKPEIAWRCAGLETGWRLNGDMHDCGCIDEWLPGFA